MLILCYNSGNTTIVIEHKQSKTDKWHIVVQKIVIFVIVNKDKSQKPSTACVAKVWHNLLFGVP